MNKKVAPGLYLVSEREMRRIQRNAFREGVTRAYHASIDYGEHWAPKMIGNPWGEEYR